jgi:hypothetical protein
MQRYSLFADVSQQTGGRRPSAEIEGEDAIVEDRRRLTFGLRMEAWDALSDTGILQGLL